jgi:hypothetical protein
VKIFVSYYALTGSVIHKVLLDSREFRKIPFVPFRGEKGAVPKFFREGTNAIRDNTKK